MIAYKFLRSGRIGPFSGFRWPEPGTWVRAVDVAACRHGVHACRLEDLPWWLADELWVIELADRPEIAEHKVVASAGRLVGRVEPWTASCAQEYADACAWRGRDRAVQALTAAGHTGASGELAACQTLDAVLVTARRLAVDVPDIRINLTIAGDGAFRALTGAAPTSAYIAAHAALRVGGPAAYTAERAWQSEWLVGRLGLRNGSTAGPTHLHET
jgi:hypothetical protein